MNIGYMWEKLHGAMYSLIGSGELKDRLYYACEMLAVYDDDTNKVPDEIINEFREITDLIEKAEPIGNEGKIRAAINSMDDVEAGVVAKKILSMYDQITRRMDPLKND